MISVCILSAAYRRLAVTRLVLEQRQRLCGELAGRGIQARMLIAADDENLDVAAEYGAETIEAANLPLGRKCNIALHHAARRADYVVWVGSDDWIHPDVFQPLLDLDRGRKAAVPVVIVSGTRLALVNLRTGRLQRVASPSKYGAIPWLIDSRLFTTRPVVPIQPHLQRGLDGALIRGLRRARVPFEWRFHDPHDFRCVDFKSDENITPYKGLAKHLGIAAEESAWEALSGWFPADLIDQARELAAAGGHGRARTTSHPSTRRLVANTQAVRERAARMPKLRNPDTGETVSASIAGAKVLLARGYIDPNAPAKKPRGHKASDGQVAEPISDEGSA